MTRPNPSDAAGLLANLEVRDRSAAARNLAAIGKAVPRTVGDSFLRFLAGSPDPDTVLVQFHRLIEAPFPDLRPLLEKHPTLVHYAVAVFGHSPWLGETLIQNPDLLRGFARERALDRSHSREEFQEGLARMRSRLRERDTALLLALFRKREYVRILLRDVLGHANLADVTAEVSTLSDVLIAEALCDIDARLRERFGPPQMHDAQGRLIDCRFAVLSLGKLGGNELNYSSDVDLLFLYDGGLKPREATISNREYFVRLAQETTELLSRHTREGTAFRIDLRLRPQGHEGELAVSLPQAVDYHSRLAQDWERQAMIKARHSAGDVALAQQFVRAVQPYVYRPNLNFAAIKTALESREKIDKRGRRSRADDPARLATDVKLDRGGIRDIEFLVQCLQRVYGGEEAWLRSTGTLSALQKLYDKDHISSKDFQALTAAYQFLRNLEHRLQLRRGQQSHRLPRGEHDLRVLARSLTREGSPVPAAEQFVLQITHRMEQVADIYRRVIYQEQSQVFVDPGGQLHLQPEVQPAAGNSHSQIMLRLAVDAPRLFETLHGTITSPHARRNLNRFLSSATTSSERYGAVLRSPDAVERALMLFEFSDYLTDLLVRYPQDVALLDEVQEQARAEEHPLLFEAKPGAENASPDPVLVYLSQNTVDRAEALGLIRQQFRQAMLVSGARDLFYRRSVWGALVENSDAAVIALEAALAIADAPAGFAIMALGRLGTREFDLLSDADVMFVRDESCHPDEARQAAERIMNSLTVYTRDGSVFPVDARLRPQGREGELVISPAQLARYMERDAQAWEAITLLRLRRVAGDAAVALRAIEVAREGIAAMAQGAEFGRQLAVMRDRLEKSDSAPNLKTGAGGAYDIDYLAGELQARHQLWSAGDLTERVALLTRHGLLSEEEGRGLSDSATTLRTVEHCVRLVTGRTGKWLPAAEHARGCVEQLLQGRGESLVVTMQRTRQIYQQARSR